MLQSSYFKALGDSAIKMGITGYTLVILWGLNEIPDDYWLILLENSLLD